MLHWFFRSCDFKANGRKLFIILNRVKKNGGKFIAPTKLAFLLLEKDEGGKRKWREGRGLNPQPPAGQAGALTD